MPSDQMKAGEPLSLFDPIKVGTTTLKNRVFMAPLTRLRGIVPGDLPYDAAGVYYAQRASAGLLIAEATNISPYAKGYGGAPGIWSDEQVAAWKKVTEAVHRHNGHIALQLWHTGRISHTSLQPGNASPQSASPKKAATRCNVRDELRQAIRVDCSEPHEMTIEEIEQTLKDYELATKNAREAGFDFVELHAAHGYLLHQFLDPQSNERKDIYGGNLENRARFTLQALDACVKGWDKDHVGIRISPIGNFNALDANMSVEDITYLVQEIGKRDIAFLHVSEADWVGGPEYTEELRKAIRKAFPNIIVGAGAYTKERGNRLIREGLIDAAAFGRSFISNPDLVERLQKDAPLNAPDLKTFYGGNTAGYIDYPTLEELSAMKAA